MVGAAHAWLWLVVTAAVAPAPPDGSARQKNTRAIAHLRAGRVAEAEAEFRAAAAVAPQDAEIATNLASVLARLGRRDEAEQAYRRAAALDPGRTLAYTGLADLFADHPERWRRRDEFHKAITAALATQTPETRSWFHLSLRLANLERAIGWLTQARRRLDDMAANDKLMATVPPSQQSRMAQVRAAIDRDAHLAAYQDWPETAVKSEAASALALWERRLAEGDLRAALEQADGLVGRYPAWQAARWLRARALLAAGRPDDAIADLEVLVRLAPSHAAAWRRLGELLAEHGGRGDMERADEALGQALALDPDAAALWLTRARVALRLGHHAQGAQALERFEHGLPQLARDPNLAADLASLHRRVENLKRGSEAATAAPVAATPVVPEAAWEKYRAAEEWLATGDPIGLAPALLDQALAEAPGFVEAATARLALGGELPAATAEALWDSGEALVTLARAALANPGAGNARGHAVTWLERAMALGHAEALFERAVIAQADGQPRRALEWLRDYVARQPPPARLPEALALRAALLSGGASRELRVRLLLAENRIGEARTLAGGACASPTPMERIPLLASIASFEGDLAQAAQCWRRFTGGDAPGDQADGGATDAGPPVDAGVYPAGALDGAWQALIAIATRADAKLRLDLVPDLERALAAGWSAAHLPLALALFEAAGPAGVVLGHLDQVAPQRALTADESAIIQRLRSALATHRPPAPRPPTPRWLLALVLAALAGGGGLLFLQQRGAPLADALARHPGLFPAVAAAVDTIRHDVLKHRVSALGLLTSETPGDPASVRIRADIARTLREPEPASRTVSAAWDQVQRAARQANVKLRPLEREPSVAPLWRDLLAAERLIDDPRANPELRAVDQRLRGVHHETVGHLLTLGPRAPMDAATLQHWTEAVRAEFRSAPQDTRAAGQPWVPPALFVAGEAPTFPLPAGDLNRIFANLLRNAEHAVAGATADGAVIVVSVNQGRDALAGRYVELAVADSAPRPLTLEMIEARESGRGLALVRELTRQWRGHVFVQTTALPDGATKSVGVRFPA